MAAKIYQFTAFEDGGFAIMARVYGHANTAITQATINSIMAAVYEYDTEQDAKSDINGAVVSGVGGSLTVASVVFDTLQTDGRWTLDSTGYNFRYDAPATFMPTGGKWYRVEIKFAPSSGAVFFGVFVGEALPIAGS